MSSPICTELTVSDSVPFGLPIAPNTSQYQFYALTLNRPPWKKWTPGQFIMIRPIISDGFAIPLSLCRVTSQSLVLFFRVSGHTKKILSTLKSGDKVMVWGPLGVGFTIQPGTPTLLIAYDSGIAPFAGYADARSDLDNLQLFFGHESPNSSYPVDAMASRIDTEDFLIDSPQKRLQFEENLWAKMEKYKINNGICLACGPMEFVKTVWQIATRLNVPTQLCLQEKMLCGVGACLGCSTKTTMRWADSRANLPLRTCLSGPVFWAKDIDLEEGKKA